jgi:hypothetical protein
VWLVGRKRRLRAETAAARGNGGRAGNGGCARETAADRYDVIAVAS